MKAVYTRSGVTVTVETDTMAAEDAMQVGMLMGAAAVEAARAAARPTP